MILGFAGGPLGHKVVATAQLAHALSRSYYPHIYSTTLCVPVIYFPPTMEELIKFDYILLYLNYCIYVNFLYRSFL